MPSDYLSKEVVSFEQGRRRLHPPGWRLIALAAGALVLVVAAVWVAAGSDGPSERQQLVAELGADVMPFDLDVTTHRFEPTATGGVQTVVADDPSDADQVDLVRQHLRTEQARFTRGDFSDPMTIHGEDMPGVATLEARFESLATDFQDAPAGGTISFRSIDPTVVEALHDWFEAQLSDHGSHAESG
jgi:hypothetical protein